MQQRKPIYIYISVLSSINQPDQAYGNSVDNVFGEENTLEFDQEEVEKLLDIFQRGFEGFSGDGEVFARAKGASKALREDYSARDFGGKRNYISVSLMPNWRQATTHVPATDKQI